jgi:hypothetical protein
MPIVLFTLIVLFERSRAFIREQSAQRTPLSNGLDQTDSALKAPAGMQGPFHRG